jgi:hypothetical protein
MIDLIGQTNVQKMYIFGSFARCEKVCDQQLMFKPTTNETGTQIMDPVELIDTVQKARHMP